MSRGFSCNDVTKSRAPSAISSPHLTHSYTHQSNRPSEDTEANFNSIYLLTPILDMSPRAIFSAMRPLAPLRTQLARRTLTTTPRMCIKEDADRSPEQLEKIKQDQLKEQKEGKGRWREELASHGESNIAADKEKVHDHDKHMKDLQQEGAKKGEKGEL
jgi:hypothetical protein